MADRVMRVHLEDGRFEDIDAAGITVCNDGSIVFHAEGGRFVCWIRADLVRRVDMVAAPSGAGIRIVDNPFPIPTDGSV